MIEQYLSNNNENAIVAFCQKFWHPIGALGSRFGITCAGRCQRQERTAAIGAAGSGEARGSLVYRFLLLKVHIWWNIDKIVVFINFEGAFASPNNCLASPPAGGIRDRSDGPGLFSAEPKSSLVGWQITRPRFAESNRRQGNPGCV
jgi:hypothetical protein